MAEHFNGLSPAEAERLTLLAEECAEVIMAIMKIKRHGFESFNPDLATDDDRGPSNRVSLEREIGHVFMAYQLMLAANDVDPGAVAFSMGVKHGKVGQYLHHQGV